MSKVPKSSVSAYLSLLVTMVISVSNMLLWLLDRADELTWADFTAWERFGVSKMDLNWCWVCLAGLAFTQTLYLWLRLAQAIRLFRRRQDVQFELDRHTDPDVDRRWVAAQSTAHASAGVRS